ncbi:hypothetical protein Ccrd_006383 [Cynara cardunculus var. scolymus]|uniref:Uncharacterized protein n=1 Tax=Cynara cardunculus var. scolymus TaxID=59895 RepID=A0A103XJ20_CYNCS|nr:hypothetical protein Ccrd_006383 [Cynara cardunculus var. scolymus]
MIWNILNVDQYGYNFLNFLLVFENLIYRLLAVSYNLHYGNVEPKGQLLLVNGKTEDDVCRNLERVLLTMRITKSEPKLLEALLGRLSSLPRSSKRFRATDVIEGSNMRKLEREGGGVVAAEVRWVGDMVAGVWRWGVVAALAMEEPTAVEDGAVD